LVRQHAPEVLAEHQKIRLTNQQFDEFSRLCETAIEPSDTIKAAAKTLDEEGFKFNVNQ
jgi:uncharacterized protein (DUF1778 family)